MNYGQLWLLSYYNTKEDVAIYGAVLRLMALVTATLNMLRLIVLPTIGDLYAKKQYSQVEKVLRASAAIAGMPAILGLLLIILFGESILFFLFGSHYAAGYFALMALSVAHLINVFTGLPAPLMLMASKERYLLTYSIVSCIAALTTSFLLVQKYSYLGVSIGAGMGIIFYNVLMVWHCKKSLSISTVINFSEIIKVVGILRKERDILKIRKRFR
jgi:O-antigen/teichoic acid export membrane protein